MNAPSGESEYALTAPLPNLARRAKLLRAVRDFFEARGFVEVETPLLANEIIPELHIEPIESIEGHFLQSSPELHMKRLMAAGATAIYQVTRSFRAGESGRLHNPEFTIIEWYRASDDMEAGMWLLSEFMQAVLGTPRCRQTTYAEAFQRTLQLDPFTASCQEMELTALRSQLDIPERFDRRNRDEWLNLLLALRVEPLLGVEAPEILYHYPPSQASLAKLTTDGLGHEVAERFELYYRGLELANGFHELGDAEEQRRRFTLVNAERVRDGRPALPLPESLLDAMESGLPDCTGVAVGFDRLAMMATGASRIDEVIAFPQRRST